MSGDRPQRPQEAPSSAWDAEPSREPPIVLDARGGLDLTALADEPLEPPPPPPARDPPSGVPAWMAEARRRMALDDFSGAIELVEQVLAADPGHAEARALLARNEEKLVGLYESKLGGMMAVPQPRMRPDQVLWLNLDHRAGFLLAQVDGTVSYEDLFALSGLPRLETARILARLVEQKVIG
ncbi:tetratricopeptide repeat protein [Anaeromyxobacter paludicola]|uniref:Uncharacterized protein n=1 Tax=Anaeromyxobacter paludicola TaxID=2918171 RepID=A0ABM7X8T6_9BACT|nr:tetratricopeptide repeat protein [Anaeromyxobacter paludicola]BDG08247.1 hypothetical protein AMPC_13600 [Anaeromyxobacter paludicola]